jgi:hypothetical protein
MTTMLYYILIKNSAVMSHTFQLFHLGWFNHKFVQGFDNIFCNSFWFSHGPLAFVLAHEDLFNAGDLRVAPLLELVHLSACHRMLPHQSVHGWSKQTRLVKVPGPGNAGEQVVRQAVAHLGQRVGVQGGHNKDMGPFSKLNVEYWIPTTLPGGPLLSVEVYLITALKVIREVVWKKVQSLGRRHETDVDLVGG